MSMFRQLRELQLSIISDLKKGGYEKLELLPERQSCTLPANAIGFEMHIAKSINNEGVIAIVVDLKDNNAPPPMPDAIKFEGVSVISSSSVDGFDISPDDSITDMHEDIFDDDQLMVVYR